MICCFVVMSTNRTIGRIFYLDFCAILDGGNQVQHQEQKKMVDETNKVGAWMM